MGFLHLNRRRLAGMRLFAGPQTGGCVWMFQCSSIQIGSLLYQNVNEPTHTVIVLSESNKAF